MRKQSLQKRTAAMGWDDLRCVLTIARTGSLNGAARVLGIEHSTVFRRLNAIEKQLGVKLFDRARSGYAPTAHGEFAATAAAAMELEALTLERHVLGPDARLSGVIRLASSELLAGFLLSAVLNDFMTAHPGVEIEVDVSNRSVDLTRREADLALRATNSPPENLLGQQVGELRYAVYGPPGMQPVASANEMNGLPWLGFDHNIAYLGIAQWQRAQGTQSPPRLRFSSLATMLEAAARGLGVAILPLFAADQHPSLARLSPVLDQPRSQLWVLSDKAMRENARVRALWRHLARHLPTLLTTRQGMPA